MKTSADGHGKTLILGIGNVLMGDEGIGVHVVRELEESYADRLPAGTELLDGGTGGFHLLEPLQASRRIVLIDATANGAKTGTVQRLKPKFSTDYPRTLTAHDIGLKDLLDAFYLLPGDLPDITLFAVSIRWPQELGTELSPEMLGCVPQIAEMILNDL